MDARRKGILLVVAAALLWSSGGIGIKAVAEPPLKVAFYRSLFAGIALFVLFGRSVWGRRHFKSTGMFIAAIVSYAACLTTFVVATKWTTAANAIFLQYAGVIWVLLFSPVITHEAMHVRDGVAIAVAIGGMALFFVGRFEARGMSGNLMALVSSVFFAALILVLRRENAAALSAIIWGNVAVSASLLPLVANNLALSGRSLALLVFLGLMQIALPYVLFVRGLRYVSATQASLTGMLEPIANPLWVFLFLGERPSVYAVAGAAVVLCAIAWHTVTAAPATEMPAVD
ncbi:MAG TPA: DMT family transporter [Thermoanaerobaculia bacterium]|nr:DMT family transporter [Thermoanaerobaculia bacterium]